MAPARTTQACRRGANLHEQFVGVIRRQIRMTEYAGDLGLVTEVVTETLAQHGFGR